MSKGGSGNVERLIKQAMRDLWKLPQNKEKTTQVILNTAIAKVSKEQEIEIVLDQITRARLINETIRERTPPPPPVKVQPTPATTFSPPAKVQPTPTTTVPPAAKVQPKLATTVPPAAKVQPTSTPTAPPKVIPRGKPMLPLAMNIPQVKAPSTPPGERRPLPTPSAKAPMMPSSIQRSQELERKRKLIEQQALEKKAQEAKAAEEEQERAQREHEFSNIKNTSKRVLQLPTLDIAESVAKNSPAWLICEANPEAGKGAKKIQVVRALADFVIDRFVMDLTRGHSYAYKSGEVQGLTPVSATPTLFGSMAPDQYLLPEAEHLDKETIKELVEFGVKRHLQSEIDLIIERLLEPSVEMEVNKYMASGAFSTDEKMIQAKLKEMKSIDTIDSRNRVLESVKAQIKEGIMIKRKEKIKSEASSDQMEKLKKGAEDSLREKLTEKLQAVRLREITFDRQVETILKQGKDLSKEESLYMYAILQDWIGKKHVVKVADKVAGPNKPYAVLSITGQGQREIKGFGIHENASPKLKSPGVVAYSDGGTRPSTAIYYGHHPRIKTHMIIQSSGKLNGVEGRLNIEASWDLLSLVAFYQNTMGAKPPIPLVVNCTDGVDRTGMVMAALMILDKYNKGDDITTKSIPEQEEILLNLIEDLRKDRGPFFLRGTTDIPIAITLGYSLIATQKQQFFQRELRGKATDNPPEINQLLEKAKTLDQDQLKKELKELLESLKTRNDISAAQLGNVKTWLNLVENGIRSYQQFNTANNLKDDYRKKFDTIQRDSDSDGVEAKARKYPRTEEVQALAGKGFKLELLNKITPIAPVTNDVLQRFYAKKGALNVYSLKDIAENTFEEYCRMELGELDQDKILAAKMLLVADIMLDRRPRVESEPLSEYEKHLKQFMQNAEQKPAGNIAHQVAKSKTLQNALIQTHGHALRAAAQLVQNNLQDITQLQADFSKNKKQIMENNPAITTEIYEGYHQKLKNAVAFYQQRINALSEADRKLYMDLVEGKPIDFDEYKRSAKIMSSLLRYQSTDVEPLTEMVTIYNSMLMYDAFAFSMPGRLNAAQFIKLAQNPARSEDLFKNIQKDLNEVGNLRNLSGEVALDQDQTKRAVVQANDGVPYLDRENLAKFVALSELLRKNKSLKTEDIKLIENFTNALEVFFKANNDHYLNPSSINKSILEAARASLQTACNSISEEKKKEMGELLDKDKELIGKFKKKMNYDKKMVISFTSILEGLELAKKAFVSAPISVSSVPAAPVVPAAPSVPVRELAPASPPAASVSPEPPKPYMPAPDVKTKAMMAEMQQKLSARSAAKAAGPARPITPMRNVEAGQTAQKENPPQHKGPRRIPPAKGSM